MVILISSIRKLQVWLESCPASLPWDGPGQVMSCLRTLDPLSVKCGDYSYLPGLRGDFVIEVIEGAIVDCCRHY